MTNEEKDNLENLLSTNDKVMSKSEISLYFNEIFNDLLYKEGNNSNTIGLDIFKNYFQLPYFITQNLFMNIFNGRESNSIDCKKFVNGILSLYFSPVQNKIKTIFKFYDVLNVEKICTDDIIILLRNFHLMTKNNNFESFENLIKYSLGYNYKNKELTFEEWENFLKENSDLFILTIYFLEYFKPFQLDNIFYLFKTKNFKRKNSLNFHSSSIKSNYIKPNDFSNLADCSNILYDYINEVFKLTFEYKEHFSDNDDEMDTLNNFEKEKITKFINLTEEGGSKIDKNIDFKENFIPDNNNKNYKRIRRRTKQFKTTIFNTNQFKKKMKINSSIIDKGVIGIPAFFLQAQKLDCFIFPSKINEEEEEIKATLYILNDDIFVFYYENNLISFHNIINMKNLYPSLDTEVYKNKKYFVLKLYINFLKVYIKNSKSNISPFIEFYCDNKEKLLEFYDIIAKFVNKQKPIKELFELNNDLINGQTGVYYKCFNKKNLEPAILKIISKNSVIIDNIEQIRNECDIFDFLYNIKDENILFAKMKIEDSSNLYFIYEYPTEGQLLFYLKKIKEKKLTVIRDFLIRIIKSLVKFHQFGFFYDDLILNSIFVFKEENKIIGKIITFENTKFIFRKELFKSSSQHIERFHSPEFPPEISNAELYNLTVDTWHFGSLIYILLFQNMPFGRRDSSIAELKDKVNYNLIIPKNCFFEISKEEENLLSFLKDIIFSCLQNKYQKRPTLKDILSIINS